MRTITTASAKWIDVIDPSEQVITQIADTYDFHELDREAILEEHQITRVDRYPSYLFAVFHFPKYDGLSRRYTINEIDLYLRKDALITFRYVPSRTVNTVFDRYQQMQGDSDSAHAAYMLYDLLDGLLDKTFRMVEKIVRDLRGLEKEIFTSSGENAIREIMIRRRNIISLKHMVRPQIRAMRSLELEVKSLFGSEVEAYFENLEDKAQQLTSEIEMVEENIASMESTLRALYDVRWSAQIRSLTAFSVLMLPLTFVTGFFGMNTVQVPYPSWLVYGSLLTLFIVASSITFYFLRRK